MQIRQKSYARQWLHEMDFKVRHITKEIYYDGHERQDVIEIRDEFLRTMTSLGFLHETNTPNQESASHLPSVPVSKERENTIFWFHDKSTFNANEDEPTMWKDDTMQVIKPKGRGAGIMVSDFIEEKDGYLALPDSTYQTLSALDPTLPRCAPVLF